MTNKQKLQTIVNIEKQFTPKQRKEIQLLIKLSIELCTDTSFVKAIFELVKSMKHLKETVQENLEVVEIQRPEPDPNSPLASIPRPGSIFIP